MNLNHFFPDFLGADEISTSNINSYLNKSEINKLFYSIAIDKIYPTDIIFNKKAISLLDNSIVLYAFEKNYKETSITHINSIIKKLYNFTPDNYVCFGQDVFGNQFCLKNEGIFFLNIETGDIEFLAKDFHGLIDLLLIDYEVISGCSLKKMWEEANNIELSIGNRLVPRIPFILGGTYHINNIIQINQFELFSFCASIARQIHGIPDGSYFNIKIK